MTSHYSAHIRVTEAAATKLSIDTVDQGDSVAWHEERKKNDLLLQTLVK